MSKETRLRASHEELERRVHRLEQLAEQFESTLNQLAAAFAELERRVYALENPGA